MFNLQQPQAGRLAFHNYVSVNGTFRWATSSGAARQPGQLDPSGNFGPWVASPSSLNKGHRALNTISRHIMLAQEPTVCGSALPASIWWCPSDASVVSLRYPGAVSASAGMTARPSNDLQQLRDQPGPVFIRGDKNFPLLNNNVRSSVTSATRRIAHPRSPFLRSPTGRVRFWPVTMPTARSPSRLTRFG